MEYRLDCLHVKRDQYLSEIPIPCMKFIPSSQMRSPYDLALA